MKIARTRVPKQCEFDEMVGANLKYMRKFRQLAMTKVAEQLPFTFQQLQKYENGRNTISAYKLLKLCKIYKADIGEIVKESFIFDINGYISVGPLFYIVKMEDGFNKASNDWKFVEVDSGVYK